MKKEKNCENLMKKEKNCENLMKMFVFSVADPGCLSLIPDSDIYPWQIPDPKTATKEKCEKKISCHTFFCSYKFHKIENYFIFEMLKKKIWANFQRIIELFTKKIVTKLSKISGIRDPGSGKNLFRIPYPGVKKAPDPGSRIRCHFLDMHASADLTLLLQYVKAKTYLLSFLFTKTTGIQCFVDL